MFPSAHPTSLLPRPILERSLTLQHYQCNYLIGLSIQAESTIDILQHSGQSIPRIKINVMHPPFGSAGLYTKQCFNSDSVSIYNRTNSSLANI